MSSLPFFQFMEKLEQSGSRIPHAESVKCTFSLIVTLHITKTGEKIVITEDRSKKSVTHLSHYSFEETIFAKKIFSETTYACVLTCQSSSFKQNFNEF